MLLGDVDRALRTAWCGLWTPPLDMDLRPGRWGLDAPRVEQRPDRVRGSTVEAI
jgi:hypothetical protein